MTAKEELRELKSLKEEIYELNLKLEAKRTEAEKITPTLSDGCGGNTISDKVGNGVVGLLLLQDQINKSIDKASLIEKDILEKIDRMQNSTNRRILRLRYTDLKTWKQISALIGYSLDWTYTLHGEALKEYSKVNKTKQ